MCEIGGVVNYWSMEYYFQRLQKDGFSIVYQSMELEYQTHRNVDIHKQLNRLDKVTSKLALTVKDLGVEALPQPLKDKITNLIVKDNAHQLLKLLDKEVVSWTRELGAKATQWNLIHICSKFNAANSLRKILKQIYQEGSEEYVRAVNTQTSQGFTPLMISIIYHCDKVLELLLQMGGIDLSIIERGKLRAYDLALHYRNQYAISQLIVYEDRCKKRQYLNEEQLQKTEPDIEQSFGFCNTVANYLLDCLICFKYEEEGGERLFGKKPSLLRKEENEVIDAVKVGSRRDIQDYQITWRALSNIEGQKAALFDCFKPQDIYESQFALKNNLILNQTLSDFPWLLRKVINKINSMPGQPQKYTVNLYHNFILKKVQVDECVPIVKERGEPMFLSNRSEIWPMVLQKAMAKVYGSYLALNTLSVVQALQTITGFYVKDIALSQVGHQGSIVSFLQDLSLRGYMFLLQGRPRTELNTSSELTSFAVLNCYEKGTTKKVLISCPSLIQNWQQTKDIRQLAILKAHFSRHNQSCIWIDESKLQYYFTHITVAFIKEGYVRSDLKMRVKIKAEGDPSIKTLSESSTEAVEAISENIKSRARQYRKSIFFKFKLDKKGEEPILLQITDLETRHKFDLTSLEGWKNEGHQALIREEEHPNCPEIAKFTCSPGEFLCKFDLKAEKLFPRRNNPDPTKSIIRKKEEDEPSQGNSKKVRIHLGPEHLRELQLVAWGPEQLGLELLQEEFGTVEWLENYRTFVGRNWQSLKAKNQQFFVETVNNKSMVVVPRRNPKKRIYLSLPLTCGQQAVVEGQWSTQKQEVRVLMLNDDRSGCAYCVLSGIKAQQLKQGKLMVE